jgi:DNA-binding MarR family transcriptional regulator
MRLIGRKQRRTPPDKRSLSERRAAELALMLIDFDDAMIKKSEDSALTPQARLVMGLLIHGSMTIKEALLYTPLSYRSFYTMLDRLKRLSLISVETVPGDRRIRRLILARKFNPVLKRVAAIGK